MRLPGLYALLFLAAASSAFAADIGERRFIREGMSEGEVLLKIGKPDMTSEDTGGGAQVTRKRWIYLPASGDSQTLTTVVLEKGKVVEVSREISR
jgi:hypothetical protein